MIQKYYLHIESVILQVYCNQTCNTEYESRRNRTGHLWDERLMLSPLRFKARLSICGCNKPAECHFLFVNITSEFLKQESWHMAQPSDIWHLTHDIWHLTSDTWLVEIIVQKNRSLALAFGCYDVSNSWRKRIGDLIICIYNIYIIYVYKICI